MSLETFKLKCKYCGEIMDLIDDDPDMPSWECPECRTGAYGHDGGTIEFVGFNGEVDYTYDEVYGWND